MNAIQYAILAGGAIGFGLWLILLKLMPTYPNLAQSLALLGPGVEQNEAPAQGWDKLGAWGLDKLPTTLRPIPTQDLALLQVTPATFLARKLTYALVGLLLPGLVSITLPLLGITVAWVIPPIICLVTAAVGYLLPDLEVRTKAAKARREFSATLACFVDLVAMERACGSGTRQALDAAAAVGDSWVFLRLREALDRATWAGKAGWDGLRELANEVQVSDLSDLADIMRLSGAEGAGIYRILRSKARSIREGLLLKDLAKANETNEKMSLPVSVLGIVFLAILITPALLSVLFG
ncbi:MAG: type II secretion system F family protein [Propionibacteriaceae bacterium]|jgi:pilus assembly protein TadC|nr:type II secretion system F family protein [Propionibacteriaceae bacterium]